MNHERSSFNLSHAGRERRESMRGEMIDAFAALHRTRRVRRRLSASLAAVALMVAATWAGARFVTYSRPAPTMIAAATIPLVEKIDTPGKRSVIDFAFVADGQRSLVTYVDSPASLVQTVDDAALVEMLAQMNRPAGLIEIGNSVRLTRNVVDDGGADEAPPPGSGLDGSLIPGNAHGPAGV